MITLLTSDPFPKLLAYLLTKMLPPADQEDVAQDVRVRVLLKRDQCQGNFRAWYTTIVRTTVADHYRQKGRRIEPQPVRLDGTTFTGRDPTAHIAEVNETLAGIPRELIEYALMERGDHRRTPAMRARVYRLRLSLAE